MYRKFVLASALAALVFLPTENGNAGWLDDLGEAAKSAGEAIQESVEDAVDEVTKQVQEEPAHANSDKQLTQAAQQELKRLGYKVSVDGVYGPGTKAAIVKFEQSKQMKVTGNVTAALVDRLKSTAAPVQKTVEKQVTPKTEVKTSGATNSDAALVMATQKELKRLGYQVSVDGAYGPRTRDAIMSFEKSKNLTATGNVSAELVEQLESEVPVQEQVAKQEGKKEPPSQSKAQTSKNTWDPIQKNGDDSYTLSGGIWGDNNESWSYAFVVSQTSMAVRIRHRKSERPITPKSQRRLVVRFSGEEIEMHQTEFCIPVRCMFRYNGKGALSFLAEIEAGGAFEFKIEGLSSIGIHEGWNRFDISAAQKLAETEATKQTSSASLDTVISENATPVGAEYLAIYSSSRSERGFVVELRHDDVVILLPSAEGVPFKLPGFSPTKGILTIDDSQWELITIRRRLCAYQTCKFIPEDRTQNAKLSAEIFAAMRQGSNLLFTIFHPESGAREISFEYSIQNMIYNFSDLNAPKPVVAKAPEPTGPVEKECRRRGAYSAFNYDCTCMEERADEYKIRAVLGQSPEASISKMKWLIDRKERELKIEKAQEVLREWRIEQVEKELEKYRYQLFTLENPSTATDVDPNKTIEAMILDGACVKS